MYLSLAQKKNFEKPGRQSSRRRRGVRLAGNYRISLSRVRSLMTSFPGCSTCLPATRRALSNLTTSAYVLRQCNIQMSARQWWVYICANVSCVFKI